MHFAADGSLEIQTTNGPSRRCPLEQVRSAKLNILTLETNRLPRDWDGADIGEVQGHSVETGGVFTLELSGGSVKDLKRQAAHFVHRLLRGDGEIVARIKRAKGVVRGLAGVMMRENVVEDTAGFVLLGITSDSKLRLEARDYGWHDVRHWDLGSVTLPIWLKLARREKDKKVTAFRSGDGKSWQQVGQSVMGCPTEPFPEDSEHWGPKLESGVAITGSGTNVAATAQFDHMALTASGLLGEYFADSRFGMFRFARPDGKVDFNWGLGSPAEDIPEDHFAIRWTGQIEPRFSEKYHFCVDADNDVGLWLNGVKMSTTGFKKEQKEPGVALAAGRPYDLRLEFTEGAGEASIRLGWRSASQKLEVIPASQLFYTYSTNSPEEEPPQPTNPFLAKGVWLCHGSFLAGPVESADENATRVLLAGQELSVLNFNVARVIFYQPRRAVPLEAAQQRRGVFLKNGDFVDAELTKLDRDSLTVESVLFGRRRFTLSQREAVGVVLHPCLPSPAAWGVRLLDGSVLRVRSIRPDGDSVVVQDTTLGELTFPETELMEFRRLASTSETEAAK